MPGRPSPLNAESLGTEALVAVQLFIATAAAVVYVVGDHVQPDGRAVRRPFPRSCPTRARSRRADLEPELRGLPRRAG